MNHKHTFYFDSPLRQHANANDSTSPSIMAPGSHNFAAAAHVSVGAVVGHSSTATSPAAAAHIDGDLSQLPALRARVRRHVDAVIRCLPSQQSLAYMEAIQRDYDLVMTETDPLQFVRYCDYDLLAGAKRLCLYWTERKNLFGPELAFLPLTLTGTGALTPQDLLLLQAGYPALLPNASTGCSCIFVDRRRDLPNVPVERYLRCSFYWMKVLAENDLSPVSTVLALVLVVTPRSQDSYHADLAQRVHRQIILSKTIFPINVKFHLLSIPQKRNPSFGANIVKDLFNIVCAYFQKWTDIKVHVETEPKKILTELLEEGLTMKGIPFMLGGEWTFEDFSNWCQERMEQEYVQYKDRLVRAAGNGTDHMASGVIGVPSGIISWNKAPQPPPPSDAAAEEGGSATRNRSDRISKRKMTDLLYSRLKRERDRVHVQFLTDQSANLSAENQRLNADHDRLKRLLIEAEECVADLSQDGSREGVF
ncbi:hypothetical protein ACA910_011416 [Epithemia clementina (nom. ined.)]